MKMLNNNYTTKLDNHVLKVHENNGTLVCLRFTVFFQVDPKVDAGLCNLACTAVLCLISSHSLPFSCGVN